MAEIENPQAPRSGRPDGSVIPFPMTRRGGQVRQTAETVMNTNGSAADRYWKRTIAGLRAQMASAGIDDDMIDSELRAFARAVFARIHELHEEDALRGG